MKMLFRVAVTLLCAAFAAFQAWLAYEATIRHAGKLGDARERMFEIEEEMRTAAIVADMQSGGKIVARNAFF